MRTSTRLFFAALLAASCPGGPWARAAYQPDETVHAWSFDTVDDTRGWSDGARAHWRPNEGFGGSGCLVFHADGGTDWVDAALDADRLKGRFVAFEARVMGVGVKPGRRPWFTAKFMVSYDAPGMDTQYREPTWVAGDFPWRPHAAMIRLPDNVTRVTLHAGIQEAYGTFAVDDVRVRIFREVAPEALRPPGRTEPSGVPPGEGRGARYRGVMTGHDLSDAAFAQLAAWGANLIRYQMYHYGNYPSVDAYYAWLDGEIGNMRALRPLLDKYGVRMVVDVHTGPGHIEKQTGPDGAPRPVDPDILDETWRRLARAFKGDARIYGYDLVNEPAPCPHEQTGGAPETTWPEVAARLVKVIRAIDPDTPIIVAPWAGHDDFGGMVPLDDPNIVYTPHYYRPLSYTHQGIYDFTPLPYEYPGYIDGLWTDKERLRAGLASAVAFQRKYGVPIYVGEFSAPNWAVGADRWLKDMTELFEEYGWDWTFHAYREWPGWSIEHVGDDARTFRPSEDNPRKRAMVAAFAGGARTRTPDSAE